MTFDTIRAYIYATVSYWWFVVPGLLMPIPDIYRYFFHSQGKELLIPRSVRLVIGIGCLFIAQFLAYRNQTLNLAHVIEEKRQQSVQINALTDELAQAQQHAKQLEQAKIKMFVLRLQRWVWFKLQMLPNRAAQLAAPTR